MLTYAGRFEAHLDKARRPAGWSCLRTAPGSVHRDTGQALITYAAALHAEGKSREAEPLCRRALIILLKLMRDAGLEVKENVHLKGVVSLYSEILMHPTR